MSLASITWSLIGIGAWPGIAILEGRTYEAPPAHEPTPPTNDDSTATMVSPGAHSAGVGDSLLTKRITVRTLQAPPRNTTRPAP
jgi:hypothetical protein